jgi:hypothetical protein
MMSAISTSVLFYYFKVCMHAINSWHAAPFLKVITVCIGLLRWEFFELILLAFCFDPRYQK